MRGGKEIRKVEEMLDAAISGEFRESDFNETELSRAQRCHSLVQINL